VVVRASGEDWVEFCAGVGSGVGLGSGWFDWSNIAELSGELLDELSTGADVVGVVWSGAGVFSVGVGASAGGGADSGGMTS